MMDTKILIVDDQADNLEAIVRFIEESRQPYELLQALNADIALKVVRNEMPDLIITDWEMPGVDGIDLIKALKADDNTKDIPVIMCTGIMTTSKNLETALNAGAIDYIRKPIDAIELVSRINSALKLAESVKKVKQQNKELYLSNITKDKLFGIIAHDLRNPFGSILGLSEILKKAIRDKNDETIQKYSELIYIASTNGNYLLDNLLNWSLSQKGEIVIKPSRFKLVNVALNAINYNYHIYAQKNIEIVNLIDSTLHVFADLNMTELVIRNLISNAVKFTPVNGRIEVSALTGDKYTTITIKDNGVGIAPDRLDKLFSLETGSTFGTNSEKGSGLGLNLCREFIEKQGGKIWVSSELNKGSEFKFTLPGE